MKRVLFLISLVALLFTNVNMVEAQSDNVIKKIEISLSNDSLTNLQRQAIVSEFYIGWSVNQQGAIDTSGQFINIYVNVVVLDNNGNPIPSMSKRKTIQIKQGGSEFDNWFNQFDTGFREGVIDELNAHKLILEQYDDTAF